MKRFDFRCNRRPVFVYEIFTRIWPDTMKRRNGLLAMLDVRTMKESCHRKTFR